MPAGAGVCPLLSDSVPPSRSGKVQVWAKITGVLLVLGLLLAVWGLLPERKPGRVMVAISWSSTCSAGFSNRLRLPVGLDHGPDRRDCSLVRLAGVVSLGSKDWPRDFVLVALCSRSAATRGFGGRRNRRRFPDDLLGRWLAAKAAVYYGDRVAAIRFDPELPLPRRRRGISSARAGFGATLLRRRPSGRNRTALSRAVELNRSAGKLQMEMLGHWLQNLRSRLANRLPASGKKERHQLFGRRISLGASYSDHFFRTGYMKQLMGADFNSPAFPVRLVQVAAQASSKTR